MARVRVRLARGPSPAVPAGSLNRDAIFGITGTTTHTPPGGAAYTVPPIGQAFVMETEADYARAGDYAEGTLGQAVAAVRAQRRWRIVGIRHDEGALAFYAGTSDDAAVVPAELSIQGAGGKATISMYNGNKYHLIAVPASEDRDITRVFYSSDPENNVVSDFTKLPGTVIPAGDERPHKVWVSNAASALAADVTITVEILSAVDAMDLLRTSEELVDYRPNRITTADRAHNVNAMGAVDPGQNALVAKMEEVCEALDALGYVSGPGGTNAEFVAWLTANRSDRLFGCAPYLTLAGETSPMGMGPAWAAGHAAKGALRGFWANPNGGDVQGVGSLERFIQYDPLSDTASSSIITAANGVSMFRRNGYHLLGGNLMVDPTDADAVQQGSARLVLDDVQRHAESAGSRGLELNIGLDLVDFVGNIVRNRLGFLQGVRAVNSYTVRAAAELNTPEALNAGDVYFDIDVDVVKNTRSVNWNIYHT